VHIVIKKLKLYCAPPNKQAMKKILKVLSHSLLLVMFAIGGFASFISIRGIPSYEVQGSGYP
jgi:hypothetical protein